MRSVARYCFRNGIAGVAGTKRTVREVIVIVRVANTYGLKSRREIVQFFYDSISVLKWFSLYRSVWATAKVYDSRACGFVGHREAFCAVMFLVFFFSFSENLNSDCDR